MISIDELIVGLPKIHANQIQPKVGDETKINRRMCLDCRPDKICPSSSGDPSFSKSRSKNDFLLARISFFSVPPSKDEDPFFREAESSRTHIMQKSLGKFFVLLPSDQMIRHLSRGGRWSSKWSTSFICWRIGSFSKVGWLMDLQHKQEKLRFENCI